MTNYLQQKLTAMQNHVIKMESYHRLASLHTSEKGPSFLDVAALLNQDEVHRKDLIEPDLSSASNRLHPGCEV